MNGDEQPRFRAFCAAYIGQRVRIVIDPEQTVCRSDALGERDLAARRRTVDRAPRVAFVRSLYGFFRLDRFFDRLQLGRFFDRLRFFCRFGFFCRFFNRLRLFDRLLRLFDRFLNRLRLFDRLFLRLFERLFRFLDHLFRLFNRLLDRLNDRFFDRFRFFFRLFRCNVDDAVLRKFFRKARHDRLSQQFVPCYQGLRIHKFVAFTHDLAAFVDRIGRECAIRIEADRRPDILTEVADVEDLPVGFADDDQLGNIAFLMPPVEVGAVIV